VTVLTLTLSLAYLVASYRPGGSELKGVSEEELLRIMTIADADGDGALSYEELLHTALNRKLAAKEERYASNQPDHHSYLSLYRVVDPHDVYES
jgi:hypothetical protein